MAIEKYITENLVRYIQKGGAAMILLVASGLFLNYYNVINLDNIPIPYLTVGLWIYLMINAGIATPFHYLRKKSDDINHCPNCGELLEISPKFHCKNCGDLEFKN